MGRSEALLFAKEGAAVVVADILEVEGRAVVDEITSAGGKAVFVELDVTKEPEWQSAIATALMAFGKLDILVNNAGISGTYDPDLFSTSAFDLQMTVNAKSVFLGMKHARAALVAAGGGSIVNSSSISASIAQNGVHMGYSASKAAVKTMTKVAALQFAPDNIRVNCVAPGMLPPMRTSRGSADPAWRAKSLEAVPMKRAGRVGEVAYAVLFLASDEASYITGDEVAIDGGYLAV
jgi:NAD(P)-dependent dehydrogenase (short-subunit alcohol dehydrogenase family)